MASPSDRFAPLFYIGKAPASLGGSSRPAFAGVAGYGIDTWRPWIGQSRLGNEMPVVSHRLAGAGSAMKIPDYKRR